MVAKSFKAHYNHPYMNWGEVPLVLRDRWFLEFKRLCAWKLEYDARARRDYESKYAARLKDSINKAVNVPLHKKVKFMDELVRAEFVKKCTTDEDFLLRSEQAKVNCLSGQTEGTYDPGHRQCSISTADVAAQLASANGGVLPPAADVYKKTHSVSVGVEGETELVGVKANHIMAEYYEKLADYKKKEIAIDPNNVYLEVVGGQKKGKVYGLGSVSQMYYKNPLSSHTSTSSATPSMISQLTSQLEEMKKMAQENQKMAEESLKLAKVTDEKFKTEKAAWRKERIAMLDKLLELTTLIKNSYKCKSPFPLTGFRDPRDPSRGGSPCAT